MFPSSSVTRLYLADTLKRRYPELFSRLLSLLHANDIPTGIIQNTRDVWCRDYMPVQVGDKRFVGFTYFPDYLRPRRCRHLITGPETWKSIGHIRKCAESDIVLDGGNIVHWRDTAILTDKIFRENPRYAQRRLLARLAELLEINRVITIPVEPGDVVGHADGVLRFVDEHTVLLNRYAGTLAEYGREVKKILKRHHINWLEFPYAVSNRSRNGIPSAEGNYVNFLHVKGLLILPLYDLPNDEAAFRAAETAFPSTVIKTVACRKLAKNGGVLNCVSWGIAE